MKIDYLADAALKITTIILFIWSTYDYRTFSKKMESSTTNKEENNNDKLLLKYLYHREARSFFMFLLLGTTLVYIYTKVKTTL